MSLIKNEPVDVSPDKLVWLMAAAERAADAASGVTLQYFRSDMQVDNKAGGAAFDPVTLADRQAELVIRKSLQDEFPDIGFHGEEHDSIVGGSGLTWVVDPIDGTRAFMSGMPMWGTLIGLFNGRDSILGVLDQPFLGERFKASGSNAQMQSRDVTRNLKTRTGVALSESTMYCTTPDMFDSTGPRAAFERVRDSVRLTRYGGDCYAYALLAAGFVDIVLDCNLQPYDIMALIPIIEAAGGVVSSWDGHSAVDGGFVVAAGSAQLHKQTLELLKLS